MLTQGLILPSEQDRRQGRDGKRNALTPGGRGHAGGREPLHVDHRNRGTAGHQYPDPGGGRSHRDPGGVLAPASRSPARLNLGKGQANAQYFPLSPGGGEG